MIKACFFDLGDTLIHYKGIPVNWDEHYTDALMNMENIIRHSLTNANISDAKKILDKYDTLMNPREIEVSCDDIFSEILTLWNVPLGHLDQAVDGFFQYFQRNCIMFNDTLETLFALKKKYKLGIFTDVPYGMKPVRVFDELAKTKILEMMDIVLTSYDVGYRKPSIECFKAMANSISIELDEFIYVGNEKKDIYGARNAGVESILIHRKTTEPPSWGQAITISTLSDLQTIL